MAKPLTPAERAAIVAALEAGESVNGASKRFGRSLGTVHNLAHAAGVDFESSFPQRVAAARDASRAAQRDYDLAARLELINRGFDKLTSLLDGITDVSDAQRWTVAIGVLIDKRRLEDGDSTSRTEIQVEQPDAPAVAGAERAYLTLLRQPADLVG